MENNLYLIKNTLKYRLIFDKRYCVGCNIKNWLNNKMVIQNNDF